MAKQQSKLLTIYDNVVLREKVDKSLDDGISYDEIADMCKSYGVEVSKASITRYAQKRDEAIKEGQDLRELLDGDMQKALSNIKKKQVKSPEVKEEPQEPELVKTRSYSVDTMLSELIKLGYNGIIGEVTDGELHMAPKDWTAIVKLFTQINGNNNHGLTTEGLQQLRLFQTAMNNAIVHVILEYVPQDKQEEAVSAMREEEMEQFKNLDLSEQGRALHEALELGNIDMFGEKGE